MPGMCSVPGCKGYKKARSRGVVFHSLPTRDPGRCKKWLKAIQNPKFNENTPGPSTSSLAAVRGAGVDTTSPSPSLPNPISLGAVSTSPLSAPPAELCESFNAVTVDHLHQETESSPAATSKSDENSEKAQSQSKTIVNDSCLMELFKKCQTCGQTITKKKVSHSGAQKTVRWSCLGGHSGTWMSSPYLWEAFPEIHLLTTLSVLFSGGTFTHFKKWAKHLHLNFMGHKTFFEIQKAYLTAEMTPVTRTEQEGVFAKGVHQQPEGTPHMSGHLKKMKARSRRKEKGDLSPWLSYEKRSSVSLTSTGTCMQEPSVLSSHRDDVEHQSETTAMVSEVDWLQDRSGLDSDLENIGKTPELSAPAGDDCDEGIYIPVIPQRSTSSELLLECEEEKLEPWQKPISHDVHIKEEDDVRELSDDKTDFKPDPSLLQKNTAIVASPQLTSNSEFTGCVAAPSQAGSSFILVPVTVKTEEADDVHTSEVHQISYHSVSSPIAQCPAGCTTSFVQLHSNHCNSQTLCVPFSLPSFAATPNQ